jgi:plasmid maintenance system antidote protein VapI
VLNVAVLEQFIEATPLQKCEIAKAIHLRPSTFSQKVKGQRKFTIDEALNLAEVLQLNYVDFKKIWGNGVENVE